ncbi:hypothetical protein Fcan01_22121 [Folsomia candida]|uniref:Uncharacterized protein n=1 Tax=Folsomia candida TaxID=158441 RepID=A0A226DEB9_FOLCA|nr:hypothetical protein Fcan01_22121 [Folsomia candida]
MTLHYLYKESCPEENSLLHDIRENNPLTTVLLQSTQYKSTKIFQNYMTNYSTRKNKMTSVTPTLRTSPQIVSIILFCNSSQTESPIAPAMSHLCYLVYQTASIINPDYLFFPISDYLSCSTFLLDARTRSKFIMYSNKNIWIPCFSCDVINLIEVPPISDVSTIDNIWNSMVSNMHQNLVQFDDHLAYIPGGYVRLSKKCGPHLDRYTNYAPPVSLCIMGDLENKYNLTNVFVYDTIRKKKRKLLYSITFNLPLAPGSRVETQYPMNFLLQISTQRFPFVVVTSRPSIQNGFLTYLSPLDDITWILMTTTSTLITLILCSISQNRIDMFATIYKINSLLVQQTACSESLVIFKSKILLSAWLFWCFILTDNLYKGGIFSTLTVAERPWVPETMEALVRSDLPVVSTSVMRSVVRSNTTEKKFVVNATIRNMISQMEPHVSDSVRALESKLIIVNIVRIFAPMFVELVSNSTKLPRWWSNETFDTGQTFALMDVEVMMPFFAESINLRQKRLVIRNREETPFTQNTISNGWTNIFSVMFASRMSVYETSGLLARWEKLYHLRVQIGYMGQMYGKKSKNYRDYFVNELTKPKDPAEFHEQQAVSLLAIRYTFAMCGFILLVGLVSFMTENRNQMLEMVLMLGKFYYRILSYCSNTIRNIFVNDTTSKMFV